MNKIVPKGPERVDGLLEGYLKSRGYYSVCKEYEILNAWPQIVGEKIASVTKCVRADQGKLFIKVVSSSWRQELAFMKSTILMKIRKEYKCSSLKDIVFL